MVMEELGPHYVLPDVLLLVAYSWWPIAVAGWSSSLKPVPAAGRLRPRANVWWLQQPGTRINIMTPLSALYIYIYIVVVFLHRDGLN